MIGDSEGNSYESDLHYYLGRKSEDVGPLNLSQGQMKTATAISPDIYTDAPPPPTDYQNLKMEEKDMERRENLPPDFIPPEIIPKESEREAVIIRHGDTKFTEGDKAHGWSREKMTPEGVEEVENLRLKNKPDILIASDLPRTKQTAEIVSKNHGIPFLEESEGLRTWNIGNIQGMDCKQADNILQHYVNNPNVPVPDGESFNDFKSRVLGTIEGFFKMYPGMTPGFVTHSKVQKLLDAAEKDDWKSVDADHYINGGEAPGKEKTMKFASNVIYLDPTGTPANMNRKSVQIEDPYTDAVIEHQWNAMVKKGNEKPPPPLSIVPK